MKYVLITGISTGIGHYLAELLSEEGFTIIGTYRNLQSLDTTFTQRQNIHLIRMDVADEYSITQGFEEIRKLTGESGLYAIINNAGIAVPGPLCHIPLEKIRYQYEVNVFGLIKVTQLSFDLLMKYGDGARIINISSISGLFASPFLGAYVGSKFALEGMSDSLRRELQLVNIKVILIEPGSIKTEIWNKHLKIADDFRETPFSNYLLRARKFIEERAANSLPVEALRRPVLHAIHSNKPKIRYLVRKNKFLFYVLARILPVPLVDFLVQRNLKSAKHKIRPI